MKRRSVLSAAAAATTLALAGCLGVDAPSADGEQHHLEVTVQNDHDRTYDAHVAVTHADGEVVFDQTYTLGPGEGRGFGDDYPAGVYTVSVDLANRGALRSHWDTDTCDAHRVTARIDPEGHLSNEVFCTDRTATTTG